MNVDSLPTVRTRDHIRFRRKKLGIGTVVSSVIMVAAVAMLGSVVLIWANSSLNVEKTRIANDYANNTNTLRESFIIEDVWLSTSPANYVNLTIRNVGDIAVKIKEVNVTSLKSDGTLACTGSPPCTQKINPSNSVIESKQSLMIAVASIKWYDPTPGNINSLDITITTERGSIEKMFWKVR